MLFKSALELKHAVFLTSVSNLISGTENSNICSFFGFKNSGLSHHNVFSLEFLVIPERVIKSNGLSTVGQQEQFSISVLLQIFRRRFSKIVLNSFSITFIQFKVTSEPVHK